MYGSCIKAELGEAYVWFSVEACQNGDGRFAADNWQRRLQSEDPIFQHILSAIFIAITYS